MKDYFPGSRWSSEYAKKAMPALVNFAESRRFAESQRRLTYTDLAELLLGDKKFAYPLMAALGRLGEALKSLSKAEAKKFGKIPPIQLLVCGKRTDRPGNLSLGWLGIRKSLADRMSEQELDSVVRVAHQSVFSYTRWQEVLKALDLQPITLKLPELGKLLSDIQEIERRSKGEGDEHKRLKSFLAKNPWEIGIQWKGVGETEQALLSGDRIDISFRDNYRWIAVEVKPKRSPPADLVRGIFQCIKYRAVLAAQRSSGMSPWEASSASRQAPLAPFLLADPLCQKSFSPLRNPSRWRSETTYRYQRSSLLSVLQWPQMNTRINVRLPKELLDRVREKSRLTGLPMSRIVRNSLEKTLSQKLDNTLLKYVGSIKGGPPDLSSRKGYSQR